MIFKIGDMVKFNKTTKKSIKNFFIASLIDEKKIYEITAINKLGEIKVFEVRDSDDNYIHCTVDKDFKFFNKKTKYRLFRRA